MTPRRAIALRLAATAAATAMLAACAGEAPTGEAASPPGIAAVESGATGWPSYGGQPSGTKYSALDQINRANVGRLELAWTYHTGDLSTDGKAADFTVSEMTPIYANDRLYICTPFSRVEALDPATGRRLWSHDPKKPLTGNMYKQNYCRGVAYWQAEEAAARGAPCGKRVFFATQNAVLLALDADSGAPCPAFGDGGRVNLAALDYRGEGLVANTSPPAIYRNVVIVGGAVADNVERNAQDGIVRGFDAVTGKELWNWNPIPAEISAVTGGANAWAPLSVDTRAGLVFLPTGSASYDTYGVNRKIAVPHANAVVAPDALTGKLVWSYQTVRHDLWDYDVPAMPTLATIDRDGRPTEAVIQGTKTGAIFVLDRKTGKPLFPVREIPAPKSDIPGEVTAPTQPMPVLPEPVTSQAISAGDGWGALGFDAAECRDKLAAFRNEGIFTPPSVKGSLLHPSFLGGVNSGAGWPMTPTAGWRWSIRPTSCHRSGWCPARSMTRKSTSAPASRSMR